MRNIQALWDQSFHIFKLKSHKTERKITNSPYRCKKVVTCKAYDGPDTEETDDTHNNAGGRLPHGLKKVSLKYSNHFETDKSLYEQRILY